MKPLFVPDPARVEASRLRAFERYAQGEHGAPEGSDAAALHRWSLEACDDFWRAVWSFCGVVGDGPGARVRAEEKADDIRDAQWFPDARINFAENLLRRTGDGIAILARDETGRRRELRWRDLHTQVAHLAAWLRAQGVVPGDRVAGVVSNAPEAVVAMLATTSLGAIWSSCSPDFGVEGIVDRFGQIEPRVLFAVDAYGYGGKVFAPVERIAEVREALPTVERLVLIDGLGQGAHRNDAIAERDDVCWYEDLVAGSTAPPLAFERFPFEHPLAILYSSGTTGKPKCIVHGAGGTLLQHLKEHQLHSDIRPGDRVFYFTTCGWMMWNWLVSALASEATLVLYDGSPFHPGPECLFDLAEQEAVDIMGVSAKFIDAVAKEGLRPRDTHDLSRLRMILSTGSPLVPEGFDYVYQAVKPDVQLASISGGTDILSCFVLGHPALPVYRGEIQAPGLGMAVDVFDDAGKPVGNGAGGGGGNGEGELVCTRPFPSRPVMFWGDEDGTRYAAAYFERFPGVWCHGDWMRRSEHGGFVISGRSDAVLNPGGVRIGTAEIYRQVERLDWVVESIAIGQASEGDVRVVLFVKLREGRTLDDEGRAEIRRVVREHASPRHVPARIAQVPDIPRTRSGKITELAVSDVVHDRPVKNVGALANPEALDNFRDRDELRD